MAVNEAGISSLGVRVGYGAGTEKPTAFTWLERCNAIGGISLETEQIDASALEDYISRYIQGRQDTGGTWELTFNITDEVVDQLEALIAAYNSMTAGQRMWFEVWSPQMTKAFLLSHRFRQTSPCRNFHRMNCRPLQSR